MTDPTRTVRATGSRAARLQAEIEKAAAKRRLLHPDAADLSADPDEARPGGAAEHCERRVTPGYDGGDDDDDA